MTTALSAVAAGADPTIHAIRQAASRSGVDFAFMLAQAAIESGFDLKAQAPTSSGRGLYQFTDATRLAMVRDHGAEIGLGGHAQRIQTDGDGRAVVKDKAARAEILALRDDPRLSAELAARLAQDNRSVIEESLGSGHVGATELYLAHFLGAGQATRFMIAFKSRPDTDASRLFPVKAKANPGVFLDAEGRPRSVRAIYDAFARRLDTAMDITTPEPVIVAQAPAPRPGGRAVRVIVAGAPRRDLAARPSLRPATGPARRARVGQPRRADTRRRQTRGWQPDRHRHLSV
ncbi:MAG: hypothetical protein FJX36_01725 [Alphaproteobacteria bacterium]|nr:hypothetical protein [Alphaproteobacteria bacterium]